MALDDNGVTHPQRVAMALHAIDSALFNYSYVVPEPDEAWRQLGEARDALVRKLESMNEQADPKETR